MITGIGTPSIHSRTPRPKPMTCSLLILRGSYAFRRLLVPRVGRLCWPAARQETPEWLDHRAFISVGRSSSRLTSRGRPRRLGVATQAPLRGRLAGA
jgi:hypothetical protein